MQTLKPKVFKKFGKKRLGKGFSREELKRAGLSVKEALKLKIPIDTRRKTTHEENVKLIKDFLKNLKKSSIKGERKTKNEKH